MIAETAGGGATGSTGTVREYLWLYETEIAPTRASRTEVDRPLAVIDAVNTVSPVMWHVHVDHLNRPKKMTNASKASVWDVDWAPWGAPYAITGSATLDARFPGQWYQMEAGLHYNWHRHYDPTLGRYTQPDPLGFVDGPNVYAYARSAPHIWVDPTGLVPGPRPPREPNDNACHPRDDALERCLKAADSDDEYEWESLCQVSRFFFPLDKTRSQRCRNQAYKKPQEKRNFCYNEFGT